MITTILELGGSLLLIAALFVFLAPLSLAGALAAAGVAAIVLSAVISIRTRGTR